MGFPIYYFTGAQAQVVALGADESHALAIIAALDSLTYQEIAGRLTKTNFTNLFFSANTFHTEDLSLGYFHYRSYQASTIVVTFGWAPPPSPPDALWILGAFKEPPESNRTSLLRGFSQLAQAAHQTPP